MHSGALVLGWNAVGVRREELGWCAVCRHDRDRALVRSTTRVGRGNDRAGHVRDATRARDHRDVDAVLAHLRDEPLVPLAAHALEIERAVELQAHSGSLYASTAF